ncbi:15180_t:CDS:2, partial [Racocetra fulgida]
NSATSHYNPNDNNSQDRLEPDKELSGEEESSNEESESEESEDKESESENEIDDSTFAVQDLTDLEKNDVDKLIIDLTTNLSDPTIELQINEFDHTNDSQILTEDVLDDEKIGSIVLDEQQEFEEGDASDTDEEAPEIPIIEGLNGLTKFISFVEQQK